jgi:hypothetical protein
MSPVNPLTASHSTDFMGHQVTPGIMINSRQLTGAGLGGDGFLAPALGEARRCVAARCWAAEGADGRGGAGATATD